jgi:hypothetical protein
MSFLLARKPARKSMKKVAKVPIKTDSKITTVPSFLDSEWIQFVNAQLSGIMSQRYPGQRYD